MCSTLQVQSNSVILNSNGWATFVCYNRNIVKAVKFYVDKELFGTKIL